MAATARFAAMVFSTMSSSGFGPARHHRWARRRAVIYNHMVVYQQSTSSDLDALFGALADATRRDIVARVMGGDASVSELAAHYDMSFAAVQKHVAVLERARLVTKRKAGRMRSQVAAPRCERSYAVTPLAAHRPATPDVDG